MIEKIKLKNITSYKEEACLETDKKINLIYGLNGSGKTTLSDYLKSPKEEKFSECTIDGFNENNEKIMVYNRTFIEENFYESDVQSGIFTLAKHNKEALENIKRAETKKKGLKEKLDDSEDSVLKKLSDVESKIKDNKNTYTDEIWKIKTEHTGGDRVFDNAGFLDRLKARKEDLFSHILGLELAETEETIEKIKEQLKEITGDVVKREKLQVIDANYFSNIERNSLFKKKIIGKEDSPVASLIKELKNSDWVKEGLDKYVNLSKNKNCPFCQEETLTETLVANIKNYFDGAYEKDIKDLKSLKDEYENLEDIFAKDNFIKDFLDKEQKLSMEKKFNALNGIFKKNINKINEKISNPRNDIKLLSSSDILMEINKEVGVINSIIDSFSEKIENKEREKERLKNNFWEVLRKQYDPIIKIFQKRVEELNEEKGKAEKEKKSLEKAIGEQDSSIKENQKKVTNIDRVIEFINKHFLDFGIQDFKIVKHEDDKYKVQRDGETGTEFKSFSEGEKTVISFLYFVEKCKGKEDQEDTKEKIIVIDDPISSLSHMYVYNVSQVIKKVFFTEQNNFFQIFILTHNLYFFNEMIKQSKQSGNPSKLFRSFKNTTSSYIEKMEKTEIQNEYQSYWSIVKGSEYENSMPIVANAMRNIIEYFFAFIDKSESINNIFQKPELDDNKYQSFKRYIDRESHSDPINISDYKDFKYNIFEEAFKKVFEVTGYKKHYEKMSSQG